MWAESAGPGQGSDLPLHHRAPASELPRPAAQLHRRQQPALKGKRLLVVDDNATNRRILALQTAKWGMVPQDTESPEEALRWVQAGEPSTWPSSTCTCPAWTAWSWPGAARGRARLPLVLFSSLGRGSEATRGLFAAYLAKPLRQSAAVRHAGGAAGRRPARQAPPAPRRPRPTREMAGPAPPAAHPAGRGQRGEPEAGAAAAGADGLPRRRGQQRHRGHRERGAPALRRGADGRADARDGRAGGHAPHHRGRTARASWR
jgi:hypothetical protein